jgi:hypothetical protein
VRLNKDKIERLSAKPGPRQMKQMSLLLIVSMLQPSAVSAQERGRIKKKPPTPVEVERIASDMVMNDGSLHKGDIVSTDRGFFLFRGLRPDGYTNDLVRVPSSLSSR